VLVYRGDLFSGLLTENDITGWLAHHVATRMSTLDIADVKVVAALRQEENQSTSSIVPQSKTITQVSGLFVTKPLLEAVLVTSHGKHNDKLLGIVTAGISRTWEHDWALFDDKPKRYKRTALI
jgi:hypothetical protein